MRECKRCNSQMEEGYVLKVTTYGVPYIERGSIGFPSNIGTKGREIKVAMCPNCGEISLYHEKASK